jgi:hypothetical protein
LTRGHLTFKETDLVRAIKSAKKAGLHVVGYEVNPKTGSIVVHVGEAAEQTDSNPWDKALGK